MWFQSLLLRLPSALLLLLTPHNATSAGFLHKVIRRTADLVLATTWDCLAGIEDYHAALLLEDFYAEHEHRLLTAHVNCALVNALCLGCTTSPFSHVGQFVNGAICHIKAWRTTTELGLLKDVSLLLLHQFGCSNVGLWAARSCTDKHFSIIILIILNLISYFILFYFCKANILKLFHILIYWPCSLFSFHL